MTSKTQISNNLDSVLMDIELRSTTDILLNPTLLVPSNMANAVIRDNKIYGFVSDNFSLVKPNEVHTLILEKLTPYGLTNVFGKIDSKGNFNLRYTSELQYAKGTKEFNDALKNKDTINPMFSVYGGIAGTKKLGGGLTGFRPVCENGNSIIVNMFEFNSKNTKNSHSEKIGTDLLKLDFSKILPEIDTYILNFGQVVEYQNKLISMELKSNQILPFFYEATKGTFFPESKFQDAFDRMKFEQSLLGYTEMNRYLAYNGLNYILEHDSLSMDLVKTMETDSIIAKRIENLSIGNAVKNFNQILRDEQTRISTYQSLNNGKEPRGKRKILELV
jgi:hypothetical protein